MVAQTKPNSWTIQTHGTVCGSAVTLSSKGPFKLVFRIAGLSNQITKQDSVPQKDSLGFSTVSSSSRLASRAWEVEGRGAFDVV